MYERYKNAYLDIQNRIYLLQMYEKYKKMLMHNLALRIYFCQKYNKQLVIQIL